MGMFDSFRDESAKCSKCHAKVSEWQTKKLESLGEYWKKGDFLQYREWKTLPEHRQKRRRGEPGFLPSFPRTGKFTSDAPLFFNAKIPVHHSCRNCKAWLEGYAKIVGGKFAAIVEVEATEKEKLLVVISPDARSLREEYENRLAHLQESCPHRRSKWLDIYWTPVQYYGRQLVCSRCEKVLKTVPEWERAQGPVTRRMLTTRGQYIRETPLTTKEKRNGKRKIGLDFRRIAEKNLRRDRELLEKLAKL